MARVWLVKAAALPASRVSAGFGDLSGYQRDRGAANSPIAPMQAAAPGLAEDVCRWLFPAARRYFENTHYGSEWEITWRRQRKGIGGLSVDAASPLDRPALAPTRSAWRARG